MELEQALLFNNEEAWVSHWRGMPEFTHEDLTPSRTLLVHFESEHDVERFAALLKQSIGPSVKSLWFPEAQITRYADKRYGA